MAKGKRRCHICMRFSGSRTCEDCYSLMQIIRRLPIASRLELLSNEIGVCGTELILVDLSKGGARIWNPEPEKP